MTSRLFLVFLSTLVCSALTYAQTDFRYLSGAKPGAGLHSIENPFDLKLYLDSAATTLYEIKYLPETNQTGECDKKHAPAAFTKTLRFANLGDNIAKANNCTQLMGQTYPPESNERFNKDQCALLVSCNEIQASKDKLTTDVADIIPEIMAEDYIGHKLDQNFDKMLQLEKARRFAEKKYGAATVADCAPRLKNSDALSCWADVVDQGFKRLQKTCSITQSYCVRDQKDYLDIADVKTPKDGSSQFNTLLNKKVETSVAEALANDNEMIENIGNIIASNNADETKKAQFEKFYTNAQAAGKLDPILSYSEVKVHFNSFFGSLLKKKLNSAQIRKNIDEFRRSAAKNIIAGSCANEMSFESLCKDATSVRKAEKVFIYDRTFLASRIKTMDEEDRMRRMQTLFPSSITTMHDYRLMMDAYRCKAFKLIESEAQNNKNYLFNEFSRVPELQSRLIKPIDMGGGTGVRPSGSTSDYRSPLATDIRRSERAALSIGENIHSLGGGENAPVANAILGASKVESVKAESANEKIKGYDDKGALANTWAEGLKDTSSQLGSTSIGNSSTLNNNTNNFKTGDGDYKTTNDQLPAIDNKKSTLPSENTYYGDKISELTKKLAQSEEGLEALKAEKVAAEKEAAQKKKIEEEASTIAQLREQINELKSDSKKDNKGTATKLAESDGLESKNQSGAFVSKNVTSPDERIQSSGPVPVASTTINSHSDSSAVAAAPVTEATASSGAARGQNSGANTFVSGGQENKLSLVLSKTDSTSNEKIYDKIFELKGEGFYIEEGGVVKEIRPLVVNNEIVTDKSGKPIFETIILGDKDSLAKSKKEKKAAAEKVVIKSHADLKRDQENKLKHDPAQYIKLKKITSEVLNKKTD